MFGRTKCKEDSKWGVCLYTIGDSSFMLTEQVSYEEANKYLMFVEKELNKKGNFMKLLKKNHYRDKDRIRLINKQSISSISVV